VSGPLPDPHAPVRLGGSLGAYCSMFGALLVAAAFCAPTPARAAPADQAIYALLGTGALARTSTRGGTPVQVARVARTAVHVGGGGPYLARHGSDLFVAFPGAPDSVFRVNTRTGRSRRIQRWRGIRLRALLVGPVTQRLYAVGNRAAGGGPSLVIKTLSPDGMKVLAARVVKHPAGTVWGAAIASDERRMAVSYHGDSEGFDLVDPASLELACRSEAPGGCDAGHGSVAFAGLRPFTSTGGSPFGELLPSGVLHRRSSRLDGSHIIEFAADAGGRFLYMSGTCAYTHGISRLDLRSDEVKLLADSEQGVLCGTRLLVSGYHLVLGANNPPYPEADATSYIRVINRQTGKLQHSIAMPGSIVDVAAGP
jgi:hypothetical protein